MQYYYRKRNEIERIDLTMGKQLYVTKDNKVAVVAKSKYEALYKASVQLGRVVDWTEMSKRTAYLPCYVRDTLLDIGHHGVLVMGSEQDENK